MPGPAFNHAVRLIHAVCGLAGSPTLIDEIRAEPRADKVTTAIRKHDTGPVFDSLMAALSYQGISNNVAYEYMEKHGRARWVLAMALSCISLGAPKKMSLWTEVGGSMIAIDTLVHNFLHRTGILHRFDANHAYGLACYRLGGCADIIQAVAEQIDARQFNASFPKVFPRFVQHAIWRYCSLSGLDICNGNRIDD